MIKSPLSLNQYVYGVDNPVSLADPDGMCPRDPDNQAGCGYTIGSTSNQRYDPSFGKVPLPWTVPPPPIVPPKSIMWVENAAPNTWLSASNTNGWLPRGTFFGADDAAAYAAMAQAEAAAGAATASAGGGGGFSFGHFLGGAWHVARFGLTLPETALGVAWAETAARVAHPMHPLQGAGCGFDGGLVISCKDTPSWAHPGGAFTLGSSVLSSGGDKLAPAVLSHEKKHADQWAIFGAALIPLYAAATIVSEVTGGGAACNNVFEIWAGLGNGNYNC